MTHASERQALELQRLAITHYQRLRLDVTVENIPRTLEIDIPVFLTREELSAGPIEIDGVQISSPIPIGDADLEVVWPGGVTH